MYEKIHYTNRGTYKSTKYKYNNLNHTVGKLASTSNHQNTSFNFDNLIPIISKQYSQLISKEFKHILKPDVKFDGKINNYFTLTKLWSKSMIGTVYTTNAVPADNSVYTVIGKFNGIEFIVDDSLEIHKNKGYNEILSDAEQSTYTSKIIRNAVLLSGTIAFVAEVSMYILNK